MIIDLYKTLIICDEYTVKVGDSVNIKIRCMGYDGQPVVSENISLAYDTDNVIFTDVTDSNGEVTTSYTFEEYGIHTLTVNDEMVQVSVERDIYPIGSVYMSFESTDPHYLFGGVWARIQGKFLFAVEDNGGDNYHDPYKESGSKDAVVVYHNHTQATHNHSINLPGRNFLTAPSSSTWAELQGANISGSGYHYIATSKKSDYDVQTLGIQSATPSISYKGENKTDKNMPPYVTVYMWRRVG